MREVGAFPPAVHTREKVNELIYIPSVRLGPATLHSPQGYPLVTGFFFVN